METLSDEIAQGPSRAGATRMRFAVLGAACGLALVTYVHRLGFAVGAPDLKRELHLDDEQMGYLLAAFFWAYGGFQILGGWLGDRLGVRHLLTLMVLAWSLVTGAIALVVFLPGRELQFGFLLTLRFLFGAFQAGGFPLLSRINADWVPVTLRGTSQGLVWMSSRIGGALIPFILTPMFQRLGTWWPFWWLAVVGFVWCVAFWPWFRNRPEDSTLVNAAELALIVGDKDRGTRAPSKATIPWARFLSSRSVWALCLAYGCMGFSSNFFIGWLPSYLRDQRGFSPEMTKWLTSLPLACGALACLWGGTLSDFIVRRTGNLAWGRRLNGTISLTIAAVASLEALLNLEASEKLDPERRHASPSRELVAQGIGNVVTGLVGGLPITTVIVRSSLNINAGARTKVAAIVHGSMLLISVALFPALLNLIPLSCLAAILLITGVKLASPRLVTRMWREGFDRFAPFAVTVLSIVLTDLVTGLLIGMVTSVGFILWSNVRQPLRQVVEKHLGDEVIRIELANQVSFLNRAALDRTLNEIPQGGHVLLDARNTDYIDPDVLSMIRDFKEYSAPARDIELSLLGFLDRYQLEDQTQYLDHSTREFQSTITPGEVLELLKEGHNRFLNGQRLTRNLGRQVRATASGQHPLAAVLGCIDSRTPAELIFDLGMGDIFSVRLAGNITSRKALGSLEYACNVAGAKLILVMGHTRCGAVNAAVNLLDSAQTPSEATGCQNIDPIVYEIQRSVDRADGIDFDQLTTEAKDSYVNEVARRNIARVVEFLPQQSQTLARLVEEGRIAIVGAMYDVVTGELEFLPAPEDASHKMSSLV
ncbi:MFS transporter [Singulisphaera rosea]